MNDNQSLLGIDKKKKISVILLIVLVLLVSIVVYLIFNSRNKINVQECNSLNGAYRDECYSSYVAKKNDQELCNNLENQQQASSCYIQIAVKNSDSGLCSKISKEDYKDYCYEQVAIQTQDANLCLKIDKNDIRDACYKEIAQKKLDKLICREISKEEVKNECFNYIGQVGKDMSVCDEIKDNNLQDACNYNTLLSIGNANPKDKNISLCDKINDIVNRKDCQRWVLGMMTPFQASSQIDSDCYNLGRGGYDLPTQEAKDNCTLDIVKNTFEPPASLCQSIVNDAIKQNCLKLVV